MAGKKSNHILGAMRHHNIVFFVVAVLVAFGIFGLTQMNKDEFPQFTIRQGVVAAIYPGASAQEVEEQVTKPLERFLFTYQEIDKERTYSVSENGIVYVFAELRTDVKDKDGTWSKIRHGLQLFKKTSLPAGVLEIVVIDDFGNTASMLLGVESDARTPRELEDFAEELCDKLRTIPSMGNIKIIGQQKEEIAVLIDPEKLSAYGIDQKILLVELATQGFRTVSGSIKNKEGESFVHLAIPYQSEYEIGEQIVYTDITGHVVRLHDIASIKRRYVEPDSYIQFNGKNTVIVSMEMNPGNNIVAFGEEVEKVLDEMQQILPPDVKMHRITNQPKMVDKSVMSFLRDLVLSILVVIAVMMLLFPLRTALITSTGVPVCTAITVGLMYICGIELNTVTLAALIVVLGMIVDDSVIVIDGYVEMLQTGHSRWYSASESTRILFVPMSLATMSICGMFYPMTGIITGPLGEFVQLFPWAVTFALVSSIFYAVWVIPYLGTRFIKRNKDGFTGNKIERVQNKFFNMLQNGYDKGLALCFRHPAIVISTAFAAIALGVFLFTRLNVQMLPKAERDCFAVEIHLTEGSTLAQTAAIADSVRNVLCADKRVKSVTSFIGCASPRFHATYSPQMAKKSYAQFIVNTVSEDATKQLLQHYVQYDNYFPNAYVRFKQMDYQAVANPIEIRLSGNNLNEMELIVDSLKDFLDTLPDLTWVHSDYDETSQNIKVTLKSDEATRLGITQSLLSLYLSNALGGQTLTSVWEDDYRVPVVLYTQVADSIDCKDLENYVIPTSIPGMWVPLRQVADITPEWHKASVSRRNSLRTITIGADLRYGCSQPQSMKIIKKYVDEHIRPDLPPDVKLTYGGLTSANESVIPQIVLSVLAAILVLFAFLLYHFANINIALLSLAASLICVFGACLGLWVFQLDFSMPAVLGVVSLIGIIVRNAIIMFEYAESLRHEHHQTAKEAAFEAGKRRMRPIFLTSATTALGVIPMILAQSTLWMPMGVVICFGTLFSLPLVVTVLPVAYWQIYKER
jgi:multidrug efflux pump